jgi:AAA+ ATPase superfamily predicted ATPase
LQYHKPVTGKEFFGRGRELGALGEILRMVAQSGTGRLVGVRGRRQVGKSRLAEHFAARSGVPYGVIAGMKSTPVEIQMRRAVQTLRASAKPLPGIDAVTATIPADWNDLLSRLRLVVRDEPVIVVFDEFPWAWESTTWLDGVLQSLWDGDFGRRPVLMLLIGSDEAMMDRLFEHDRPLFGRLDDQLVVRPFNPAETARALGGRVDAQGVFDTQLVTGGFPELIAHARRFDSVTAMVENSLSRPHTLLADVAQLNLAGELSDGVSARLVLDAIGADEVGVVNFSAIAATLGGGKTAETAVTRAVKVLADVKQIVAVDLPGGRAGSRLKRYRIADSYLRFWFRFVEPQLRNIEVGRPDLAVAAFRRSWAAWRGKAIEPLVREAVLRLAPSMAPPLTSIESVNPWWERSGTYEFDLVGAERNGLPVAVGSVKWREGQPFTDRDLAKLAMARSVIPHAERAGLLAVSPHGLAPGVSADMVLTAADLLAAWQA